MTQRIILTILCVLWIIGIIVLTVYVSRQSAKQDAIFVMTFMRKSMDEIGMAYQKDKNTICADASIQRARRAMLQDMAEDYNRAFQKYGGHYDVQKWLEE